MCSLFCWCRWFPTSKTTWNVWTSSLVLITSVVLHKKSGLNHFQILRQRHLSILETFLDKKTKTTWRMQQTNDNDWMLPSIQPVEKIRGFVYGVPSDDDPITVDEMFPQSSSFIGLAKSRYSNKKLVSHFRCLLCATGRSSSSEDTCSNSNDGACWSCRHSIMR